MERLDTGDELELGGGADIKWGYRVVSSFQSPFLKAGIRSVVDHTYSL